MSLIQALGNVSRYESAFVRADIDPDRITG